MIDSPFATRLVIWQQAHGRHGLPWQGTQDPYKVWLSEIMLQQTQVAAVKGYFGRFVERFPTIQALAAASQDEVLALWSGLGYYSRARNLHRCAGIVCQEYAGRFPQSPSLLESLPGIGPSTAAAIASICFNERVSIFDGNVQRVMARHAGFPGDLATAPARHALQTLAAERLPDTRHVGQMPIYTQGLMDLGATVCIPRAPQCAHCPVAADCVALATDQQLQLPFKTRKLRRQTKLIWWLVLRTRSGQIGWVKRPDAGVWASLHCFPEFGSEASALSVLPASLRAEVKPLHVVKHVLTHLDLIIHPLLVEGVLPQELKHVVEDRWHSYPMQTQGIGLPKPVSQLLEDYPLLSLEAVD